MRVGCSSSSFTRLYTRFGPEIDGKKKNYVPSEKVEDKFEGGCEIRKRACRENYICPKED